MAPGRTVNYHRRTITMGHVAEDAYTRGEHACFLSFVTVSMHFRGCTSLQLRHGLTSAHLHSRRRTHNHSLYDFSVTPPLNAPVRVRRTPSCFDGKTRGLVRARFIIPLRPGRKNPFTDRTAQQSGVCSRILTIRTRPRLLL